MVYHFIFVIVVPVVVADHAQHMISGIKVVSKLVEFLFYIFDMTLTTLIVRIID